jgi:hypothetical protein
MDPISAVWKWKARAMVSYMCRLQYSSNSAGVHAGNTTSRLLPSGAVVLPRNVVWVLISLLRSCSLAFGATSLLVLDLHATVEHLLA